MTAELAGHGDFIHFGMKKEARPQLQVTRGSLKRGGGVKWSPGERG